MYYSTSTAECVRHWHPMLHRLRSLTSRRGLRYSASATPVSNFKSCSNTHLSALLSRFQGNVARHEHEEVVHTYFKLWKANLKPTRNIFQDAVVAACYCENPQWIAQIYRNMMQIDPIAVYEDRVRNLIFLQTFLKLEMHVEVSNAYVASNRRNGDSFMIPIDIAGRLLKTFQEKSYSHQFKSLLIDASNNLVDSLNTSIENPVDSTTLISFGGSEFHSFAKFVESDIHFRKISNDTLIEFLSWGVNLYSEGKTIEQTFQLAWALIERTPVFLEKGSEVILSYYKKFPNSDIALNVWSFLKESKTPSIRLYNLLIQAVCFHGDFEAACSLFMELCSLSKWSLDSHVCVDLISLFAQKQDFEKASFVVDALKYDESIDLSNLSRVFTYADTNLAKSLWDKLNSIIPHQILYSSAIPHVFVSSCNSAIPPQEIIDLFKKLRENSTDNEAIFSSSLSLIRELSHKMDRSLLLEYLVGLMDLHCLPPDPEFLTILRSTLESSNEHLTPEQRSLLKRLIFSASIGLC